MGEASHSVLTELAKSALIIMLDDFALGGVLLRGQHLPEGFEMLQVGACSGWLDRCQAIRLKVETKSMLLTAVMCQQQREPLSTGAQPPAPCVEAFPLTCPPVLPGFGTASCTNTSF